MRKLYSLERVSWLSVLILAIVVPPILGGYLTSILILICIWSMMCISLNLIYGYTGQLSLGHSAFLALGAYSFGLVAVKLHIGFWPAFLAAAVITGLFGFLIGIPALKLRGHFFVLVTLGFAVTIGVIVLAWVDFTGGANGLAGIPRPDPIPLPWGVKFRFDSLLHMYYFVLLFLILTAGFCHRLVSSLLGKTFIAICHDENLTESLGVNTMSRKLLSFTISAMLAGVAGALYASYNAVISPEIAHFTRGTDVLAYLIVGGSATMTGPIVGTFVLVAIPEVLQVVPYLKTLINGVILMLFIVFLPSGIIGGFKTILPKLGGLRGRPRAGEHDIA